MSFRGRGSNSSGGENRGRGGRGRGSRGNDYRGRGGFGRGRGKFEVPNGSELDTQTYKKIFGFMRLYGFLTKDDEEAVIMSIGRNISEWEELVKSDKPNDNELFPLILHILAKKVCKRETILSTNQIPIISHTFNEHFNLQITKLYSSMLNGEPVVRKKLNEMDVDQTRVGILRSIQAIFSFVLLRCQNLALDCIPSLIPGAIGVLSVMNTMLSFSRPSAGSEVDEVKRLQDEFVQIMEQLNTLKKPLVAEEEKKRYKGYELTENEESQLHEMPPPDNFREIPITPSIEEIHSTEEPFLRTNKTSGSYIDHDHYLDVQFRLLREDFISPLRKAIKEFERNKHEYVTRKKKFPLGSNVRIYQDVRIQTVDLIKDNLIYSVKLPESVGRINWEKSKRLLNGSLLVFTSDEFKSAYFAIVAKRDTKQLQKERIIGITWDADTPDLSNNFLMLECEVYFEAYRHTLKALQNLKLDTFPMAKFIVGATDMVFAPKYLEDSEYQMQIDGKSFSPLQGPWPTAQELGFDQNQYVAFQAALTKEFSIIQGPPGTGKTYLGLRVAETFLTNLESWWEDGVGPILVVCYTNHALDQFLEGILNIFKKINAKSDPSMIRVGGRSKCEILDQYSLAARRSFAIKTHAFDQGFWQAKRNAIETVQDYEQERAIAMDQACALANFEGIVDFDSVQCRGELKTQVPKNVLSLLKDPAWFGMNESLFNEHSFNAKSILQNWFNINPIVFSNSDPVMRQKAPIVVPTSHVPSSQDEYDDDEDYDMDELLSNRIVEDVDAESAELRRELEMSKLKHNVQFSSATEYIPLHSINDCTNNLEELRIRETMLSQPEALNTYSPKFLAQEARRIASSYLISENRKYLLQEIRIQQENGNLNLPDMKTLLEQPEVSPVQWQSLTIAQRWGVYFAVVDKARQLTIRNTSSIRTNLVEAQKQLDNILRVGDAQLLRKAKVVGMTTTGAAKNHDLLQMMKSKIVIVEEAAEVLEAHIVTCITDQCQQLILIGDHQQLRPSTTVYDLSRKYHLDISLFERMINNNLNCYRLGEQHRMRPEIADLVVGTIYKELRNHPNVYNYPDVKGIKKNLFFIDHEEHEKAEADSMSKSNEHEAEFSAGLCRYLILQGYQPSEVTVLTTYTGQMFLLKKEIRKFDCCNGVRVTVVDNYQGEECEVILLSLVRSNDANNIGFLKTDNRICVAISRAKHGLYISGNMNNLTARSQTWKDIKKKLLARGEIGEELKLFCETHGNTTEVKNGADFRAKVPEGGCSVVCGAQLQCSHTCESVCHAIDREHAAYKCLKPCIKTCKNSHPCIGRCFQSCPHCNVKMQKMLPCQHVKELACHVDETQVVCMVLVHKTKPCGHEDDMACHKNPAEVKCREMVEKVLSCSHVKRAECHVDPALINCKVMVAKKLEPCGHEQVEECHKNPEMIKCETDVEIEFNDCKHKTIVRCKDQNSSFTRCKTPCPYRLECGHQCIKICHFNDDPDHIDYVCKKPCGRDCDNGHPCKSKHQCSEPCPPCKVTMEKTLSCGVHLKSLPCHVDADSELCMNLCEKIVQGCGHKCLRKCHEDCNDCQTIVTKVSPCGHLQETKCSEQPDRYLCVIPVPTPRSSACGHLNIRVPCSISSTISPAEMVNFCEAPCGYEFSKDEKGEGTGCTHKCKGNCSDCTRGRIHKRCQEECGRVLVCGHVCSVPCSSGCPPCQKECLMKCEHSVCKARCGEPCSFCKERCTWRCPHKQCYKLCGSDCDRGPCDEPCPKTLKCGHPCIGFCGEPCPPHCRICNKAELIEEFYTGYEDDEDARFVYLEDCKHSIVEPALTYYMNMNVVEGSIGAKACPRCKTVIRQCRRYGNILKHQLKDVMAVKKRVFGNSKTVQLKQRNLVEEFETNRPWTKTIVEIKPEAKHYILNKLIQTLPSNPNPRYKRKRNFKYINISERVMQSLDLVVSHFKDVHEVMMKTKEFGFELRTQLTGKYSLLFSNLMERELPFTKTEVNNFDLEFERLHDLAQLYKRKALPNFTNHAVATPIYQRALDVAETPQPYTKDIKEKLKQLIKELDDKLRSGLGISDRERREILGAIQMSRGHWYKCPNGHIYAIGDCGGANQRSHCNECGAEIGGESHRLTTGNSVATEMDGALTPAWPQ